MKLSKAQYLSIFWIIGIALLVIAPKQALPYVVIFAIGYFVYQRMPKQRAAKQLEKAKRLFKYGLYEPALKSLDLAFALKTDDNYAYYLKGACLHNIGKFKEALQELDLYRKAHPKSYDTLLIIGNCHFQLKNYAKTIKTLQPIPKEFPRYLRVLTLIGSAYSKQKKYDLAKKTYQKAPLEQENPSKDLLEIKALLKKVPGTSP